MIYTYTSYISTKNIHKLFTIQKINNGNNNNKKTFSIKMKDVGTSKPKTYVSKVVRLM